MSKIKVTDFRIGNYVQDLECEPHIFQVEQIGKYVGSELWVKYRNSSIKSKEPDPIKLTNELLIGLGFQVYSTGSYCIDLKNDDSYLAIDINYGNGVWLNIQQEGKENTIKLTHIEYVHQLQNLFFSLTGRELEFERGIIIFEVGR